MKQLAKHIDRFSIVKLPDGRIGVFERKGLTVITEWNKMAVQVSADIELEVIKNPCHLAADYLEAIKTTQS